MNLLEALKKADAIYFVGRSPILHDFPFEPSGDKSGFLTFTWHNAGDDYCIRISAEKAMLAKSTPAGYEVESEEWGVVIIAPYALTLIS